MVTNPNRSIKEGMMFVGGKQIPSESEETRDAINPATGESISRIPDGTRKDVQNAIDAARNTQSKLRSMSAFDRAALVEELGDAVDDNLEYLAEWLTRDQGKPLVSARAELELVVEMFHNAAAEIKHDETPSFNSEDPNKRMFSIRQPHGVYGVITPWNFPGTIPTEYIAPGLAVGNCIVWVPAPTTSAFSIRLMEVYADTSLPDGALNIITGEGPVVGDEVVNNDGIDAIGFTGSPETGNLIAQNAGAKPTLLELGGNGPVIVLDDANIDAAAQSAASGCFGNAGQICTASERILAHEAVIDEFTEKIVAHAQDITLGNPMDEGTDMGPLNNEDVAMKMDQHIQNAVDNGANVLIGGSRMQTAPTDLYYEPTILSNVTPQMTVNTKETFGPIAPIIEFSDYEEAIDITNSINLGLSSGVFTSSIETMYYFAEEIETGLVNINEGSAYWEIHTPVGGYTGKKSGVGRIGGRFTIDEVSQLKNIIVDTSNVV